MRAKRFIISCLVLLIMISILCACQNTQTMEIGDNFEVPQVDSGRLLCSIKDVNLITSDSKVSFDKEKFRDNSFFVLEGESLSPDQFLDREGYPIKGCCIVTMDLEIQSDNAVSAYYEEYGENIFRADSIVWLVSCAEKRNGNYRPALDPLYFSNLNSCMVHPMAFKLEPGETVCFTIGFVAQQEWIFENLEDISGSLGMSTDSTLLNLNFGG